MSRNEILGSDDSDEEEGEDEEESEEEEEEEGMEITDKTGTNMQALRRTIYLTIQVCRVHVLRARFCDHLISSICINDEILLKQIVYHLV